MTKREIASLVIRLMGVFILLKSIGYVPSVFGAFYSMAQMENSEVFNKFLYGIMIIVGAVLPLAWSVLIIIFSDKAAAWLIKDNNAIEKPETSINKQDVMVIAVSCIGLYFVVAAAPMLIRALSIYPMYTRSGALHSRFWIIVRDLIAPAVQVALGLWLFVGPEGIVKLWKKIRS